MDVCQHSGYGPLPPLVHQHVSERRRLLADRFQEAVPSSSKATAGSLRISVPETSSKPRYVTPQLGPPFAEGSSSIVSVASLTRNEICIRHDVIRDPMTNTSMPSRPKAKIQSIDWNATGSKVLAVSQAGISVCNPHTLIRERVIPGLFSGIAGHKTDSDIIAALASDGTLQIFDLRITASRNTSSADSAIQQPQAIPVCEAKLFNSGISPVLAWSSSIAWSLDGSQIAVSDGTDLVQIVEYSRLSSASNYGLSPKPCWRAVGDVNSLAFDPLGELLFAATSRGTTEIHATSCPSKGSEIRELISTVKTSQQFCQCVAVDPLGRCFMIGSSDQILTLIDINTTSCLGNLYRLGGRIIDVAFSSNGLLGGFVVEADTDFNEVVGQPAIGICLIDGIEVAWMGHTAGHPTCLSWSPTHPTIAYGYGLPSSTSTPVYINQGVNATSGNSATGNAQSVSQNAMMSSHVTHPRLPSSAQNPYSSSYTRHAAMQQSSHGPTMGVGSPVSQPAGIGILSLGY